MKETLPPLPSDTIAPEEWQQTPSSVRQWIGEVLAEVRQLRETVEQLQEIINRNSQNSSQPPDSDPRELGYPFSVWTINKLRKHLEKQTGILLSYTRFRALLSKHRYVYRQPNTI